MVIYNFKGFFAPYLVWRPDGRRRDPVSRVGGRGLAEL